MRPDLPFATLAQPILLAVVGRNISYSKSPVIHTEFGKALGVPLSYTIQDVGEGTFSATIAALRARGFGGCNITVPYKEDAFQMATVTSPRAQKAGAANTFLFRTDGSIVADNTDGIGFVRDVTSNIGYSLQGKQVLVLGAGGAVRGILAPLVEQQPASVTIANRSIDKAQELATRFSTQACPVRASTYKALSNQSFDVVVDGTSLKTELPPIPSTLSLNPNALVYDLKYSPDQATAMMKWGSAQRAAYIHDGIGMLVEQAAEAFQLWTGQMPETLPVIKMLKAAYAPTPAL